MASLTESAENLVKRYISTLETMIDFMNTSNSEDQQTQLEKFAKAIIAFRLPGCVAFGLPGPPQQASTDVALPQLKAFMNQYIKFGIQIASPGLKSSKVQVLYDHGGYGACLLDIVYTLEHHSKGGVKTFDMHAFYGYRKLSSGEEGWEFAYMDDEIAGITKNVGPEVFEGMGL